MVSSKDKTGHSHDHQQWSDMQLKVRTLESLLVEKGYIDPKTVEGIIQHYEKNIGPQHGAKVVAKAWSDPEYLERLREDATTAIAELCFSREAGELITVLENNSEEHNLVVCTLCSCYPWSVLGLPPTWYKSNAFRASPDISPTIVKGSRSLV